MSFLLVIAVAFAVVRAVLLSTYRYAGIPMGQSIAVVLPIVSSLQFDTGYHHQEYQLDQRPQMMRHHIP